MRNQLPAIFSLLDTPAMGGAEAYLLSNLEYLAAKGHPVYLATNCSAVKRYLSESQQNLSRPGNLQVLNLPFRLDAIGNWKGLVKFFLTAPRAIYWLWRVRQDHLQHHLHITCLLPGFSDRLFFSPCLKAWGYRLLWLEYGPLEPTFARNFGFPKLLYSLTRQLPDKVLTISKSTFHSLVNTGHIHPRRIEIVYPGTFLPESSALNDLKVAGKKLRTRLRLAGRTVILAVGRLASEKEFDVLIEAFNLLLKDTDMTQVPQLIVVGDGPAKTSLLEQTTTFKISSNVTFTGYLTASEKSLYFALADLFVFPSAWPLEGFGMTTIEAMSYGLPVITTGVGPQSEIITDGVEGLYFQPRSPEALAEKMKLLMCDRDTAQKLAKAGKRKVELQFNQDQMHKKLAAQI